MRLLTHVRDRIGHALRHAVARPVRHTERRDAAMRLKDGATRACPVCTGVLLFRESYRVMRTDRNTTEPAWVCHTHPCGYREFVRK